MKDCLFCKINEGTIPAKKVFEDDRLFVINDINPQAPVHLVIIPKLHIRTLNDLLVRDEALIGRMMTVARNMAIDHKILDTGWRTVFNCNGHAGQMVFHIHMHVLGGGPLGKIAGGGCVGA